MARWRPTETTDSACPDIRHERMATPCSQLTVARKDHSQSRDDLGSGPRHGLHAGRRGRSPRARPRATGPRLLPSPLGPSHPGRAGLPDGHGHGRQLRLHRRHPRGRTRAAAAARAQHHPRRRVAGAVRDAFRVPRAEAELAEAGTPWTGGSWSESMRGEELPGCSQDERA